MNPRRKAMSPHVYLPVRPSAVRHAAAVVLHGASIGLERLARQLVALPAPAVKPEAALPRVEFHAEAGALEGALYVDGQLVAMLPGVNRL
jgi:hypothetical protein